jgi:hypothetical protein
MLYPLIISNPTKKSDLSENNVLLHQSLSQSLSDKIYSSGHHNFDGYTAYNKAQSDFDTPSYIQIFRNGSIEYVWTYPFAIRKKEKRIESLLFEKSLIDKVRFYLNLQQYHLDVEPPVFIMLSLFGVAGYTMGENGIPIDRDTLIIPEVMIEKFEVDVAKEMKDIFDVIWNAAGLPSSIYYKSGYWNG